MDSNTRLRIAARIHFALLRQYGEDVAVSALLRGEGDAREALWVCEASGDDDLAALARQFDAAGRDNARHANLAEGRSDAAALPATATTHGAAPHDLAWSQDTSGFGLSRPPEVDDAPAPSPTRWRLNPARWLRGNAAH